MLTYMIDTCICIYTIKNRPTVIREEFRRRHGQLCISTVTVMELIKGVEKSEKPDANLKVVEGFFARLEVLGFDAPRDPNRLGGFPGCGKREVRWIATGKEKPGCSDSSANEGQGSPVKTSIRNGSHDHRQH